MNVLLSIKPKYANQIVNGKKKFEFRKKIFKEFDNQKIYIYSSFPVKKIIGFFYYSRILKNKPEKIWEDCKNFGGITEKDFFNYFLQKEIGFAIEISYFKKFSKSNQLELKDLSESRYPPQSFIYVRENI